MKPETTVLLPAVARLLQPLVRLLVKSGVNYGAFCQLLKPLFAKAAHAELAAQHMPPTASAISLLSGVHRADLRKLNGNFAFELPEKPSVASQVLGVWMSDQRFLDAAGQALTLELSGGPASFHELASSVSRDARPKAVLEELQRLGMVQLIDNRVALAVQGASPNQSLQAMAAVFADNLHDHLASSCYNWNHAPAVQGDGRSQLEQAVFVDELSAASVRELEQEAQVLWKTMMQSLMRKAVQKFNEDQKLSSAAMRPHRFRLGLYVYSDRE